MIKKHKKLFLNAVALCLGIAVGAKFLPVD